MKYDWKKEHPDWLDRETMEIALEQKRRYLGNNSSAHLADAIDDIDQLLQIIDALYTKTLGLN